MLITIKFDGTRFISHLSFISVGFLLKKEDISQFYFKTPTNFYPWSQERDIANRMRNYITKVFREFAARKIQTYNRPLKTPTVKFVVNDCIISTFKKSFSMPCS